MYLQALVHSSSVLGIPRLMLSPWIRSLLILCVQAVGEMMLKPAVSDTSFRHVLDEENVSLVDTV